MNIFTSIIADRLGLEAKKVENTLTLLEEGCTIPFISRYRKEKTGGLDEVMIGEISEWRDRLTELTKRKETVCKTIDEQGKMNAALKKLGMPLRLKISICRTNPSGAHELRLLASKDLSHFLSWLCFSANKI